MGKARSMEFLEGLRQIRGEMDQYIVGHDDVKEAIMLGVVAREQDRKSVV